MAHNDEAASGPVTASPTHIKAVTRLKPKKAAKQIKRDRPAKFLPTPRIAFPRQLELLRAFASAAGSTPRAVGIQEAAAIIKLAEGTARLATPFFADAGLLTKGEGGLIPVAEVMSFQRTFSWAPMTASFKLGPVISQTWFAQALLSRLGVRPIEEDEALTVLAEAAAATPEYRPQIRILLDYLLAAGLIERDGGQLRLRREGGGATVPPADESQASTPGGREQVPAVRNVAVSTSFVQPTEGIVRFNIEVKVDMQEFSSWPAANVAAFFAGISQVLQAKADVEKKASKE